MEKRWSKSKRFKVARLAKASDMDSNFNPKAVGAMRSCEGDLEKGEMGLLCGESSMRRRLGRVHQLASSLGWSNVLAGTNGGCWSWGFDGETFRKGVNLYVKLKHYDLHHEGATKKDPWTWLEALLTGMGPEPGPGVTFLPSRPQSPTHHDVFLTCASK
jgi:hypothetical protein